ncbi:MAG: hypothetical protein ACYC7L_07630 [Nitrospirota bacterium]
MKLKDPDGNSTWINNNGSVQNVINDRDLSIYQSLPPGVSGPPQKIGETYFSDSFTNGQGAPMGHVNVGQDITSQVLQIVDQARDMSLKEVVSESRAGRSLDIKASWPGLPAKGKGQQGFLFQDKYMTLRDAGNMLYGINMRNKGLSSDQAMRAAGGYAQTNSMKGAALGLLGKEYGPAPYFGEEDITGTRIDFGYGLAPSLPDNRPQLNFDFVGP